MRANCNPEGESFCGVCKGCREAMIIAEREAPDDWRSDYADAIRAMEAGEITELDAILDMLEIEHSGVVGVDHAIMRGFAHVPEE